MKILVLGGNRFFGKRLVERLLNAGDEVTLLNRGQISDSFGDRVERIVMDKNDLSSSTPQIEGRFWDIIFDQITFDAPQARQMYEVFKNQVGHYVFTSSQSVYEGGDHLTEKHFDPFTYSYKTEVLTGENYAEGKRQAEVEFFKHQDFPVSAVRFPIVLGPDDYTGRLKFHIERIQQKQTMYFPSIESKLSFISSEDAALSLEHVGKGPVQGPINCCSTKPVQLKELMDLLQHQYGGEVRITNNKSEGEPSPYGVSGDWCMVPHKLFESGLVLKEVRDCLPSKSA